MPRGVLGAMGNRADNMFDPLSFRGVRRSLGEDDVGEAANGDPTVPAGGYVIEY